MEDLPPPSPELAALSIFAQAHMRSLKPKERIRFERALAEVLEDEFAPVLSMRPPVQHAASRAARKAGGAWVRTLVLVLMAKA